MSRSVAPFIKYALLSVPAVIALASLAFCVRFTQLCGDVDESLMLARGLSQEQLKSMYLKVEELHRQFVDSSYQPPPIPGTIAGVEFKHLSLMHEWMVIGGCFDNKSMLHFKGFENSPTEGEAGRIVLRWGEHPVKTEVLWTE